MRALAGAFNQHDVCGQVQAPSHILDQCREAAWQPSVDLACIDEFQELDATLPKHPVGIIRDTQQQTPCWR